MSHQAKFRLNKINKIKDHFNAEVQERKMMRKNLSKYIAGFDYFNKTLILSSAASGEISITFLQVLLKLLQQ